MQDSKRSETTSKNTEEPTAPKIASSSPDKVKRVKIQEDPITEEREFEKSAAKIDEPKIVQTQQN